MASTDSPFREHLPRGLYTFHSLVAHEGRGSKIVSEEGREFLDLTSGLGVLHLGHNHPALLDAMEGQLHALSHMCSHVMLHRPYLDLAKRLNEIVPIPNPCKTFLCHAGAEAVENAVKIARYATGRRVIETSGLIHLTSEELARTPIEVTAVARGQSSLPRSFPATVQSNENELAEVTTLTRGRVVKVHVDVGQDVKKDTLLAVLHSSDLGVAEGAYLKAKARLHEAELVYERAKDLHEHKAVSLAELQRREAEMKTARAEARESYNRLELLGVPREEVDRLDRKHTIKADVPLRAPFDGRVIMRNITRGEVVETQQKLITVADLSDVWVVGNVPEKDAISKIS